ncbi:MAG: response regulator [Oscillospiraceae bacterium]|nr:response regulator [Oscillospiraceae bacterium]
MPVTSGAQVLEMIRSEPGTAHIPVIFLTGKDDSEGVRRVLELKPDGYILKSIDRGMVYTEDFGAIQSSIDEQIADSANENFDYVEYRIVRKDGELRWLDDYGHYALLSGYGEVYYVFISDITDKRSAQEEQRSAWSGWWTICRT